MASIELSIRPLTQRRCKKAASEAPRAGTGSISTKGAEDRKRMPSDSAMRKFPFVSNEVTKNDHGSGFEVAIYLGVVS